MSKSLVYAVIKLGVFRVLGALDHKMIDGVVDPTNLKAMACVEV